MARKAPREDASEDALEVGPPQRWAAGVPAVTHALRDGVRPDGRAAAPR